MSGCGGRCGQKYHMTTDNNINTGGCGYESMGVAFESSLIVVGPCKFKVGVGSLEPAENSPGGGVDIVSVATRLGCNLLVVLSGDESGEDRTEEARSPTMLSSSSKEFLISGPSLSNGGREDEGVESSDLVLRRKALSL